MAFHWRPRNYDHAQAVDDPWVIDPDFEDSMTLVTVRFPLDGELTDGERRSYDASWFRISGARRVRSITQ